MKSNQWATQHWVIHNAVDKSVDTLIHNIHIQEAAAWINKDEVVAFPTETVYGLGANAYSVQAVQRIYEAKGRPSDNPLIIHISAVEQLNGIVDNISEMAKKLIQHFWPGSLTLIFPKHDSIPTIVTGGLGSVAVRMPDHPVALALIQACNKPLAAPSANLSGKPSPTQASHVLHDLQGLIPGVLDGGLTGIGVESTVLDLTGEVPMILRPGGVTKEQLEQVIGRVEIDPALTRPIQDKASEGQDKPDTDTVNHELQPRSPGVKYTHYAPEGEMYLVGLEQGVEEMRRVVRRRVESAKQQGYRVGVLTTDEGLALYQADHVLSLGSRIELEQVARSLYHALRQMDQMGIQRIYAESFPSNEVGLAIMNRLYKAAGGRMIHIE